MKSLIALWGVAGVLAIVGQAVWSLTPLALEPFTSHSMTWWQTALYVGFVVFNAYAEGYRGFHKAFAPRAVGRSFYLAEHRDRYPGWYAVLAPLYAMAMFSAQRRRLIASWILVAAIVLVVVVVRQLPQPWRGIIDGGVVVGLSAGMLSMLWFYLRSLFGRRPAIDLALPASESGPAPSRDPQGRDAGAVPAQVNGCRP